MFRKTFVAALASSLVWPTSVLSAPSTGADSAKPKVILDNDWKATDFTPYLLALKAGWEVLGLISNTGDVWAKQATLHALATLEMGNLSSCIPVYYGADYPLVNNPELYRAWSRLYGKYPWEGAYAPENKTQEAQGGNPTGGNPRRINKAAFVEGLPKTTYVKGVSAAEFLVQTVRKYPGEVTIYSAGTLTNIALAQRLDSTFAQNTKGIVLMGGFIDNSLLAATGSYLQADLQTDFNLKLDPEASKIVLTAPFPNITLVGNGANQFIPSETFMQELHDVKTPYTEVLHKNLDRSFPFWDETTAAVMVDPDIVTNSTEVYVDVDTAYASANYGNIHAYQEPLKPEGQTLQKVRMVISVDDGKLGQSIKEALQYPATCDG